MLIGREGSQKGKQDRFTYYLSKISLKLKKTGVFDAKTVRKIIVSDKKRRSELKNCLKEWNCH